MQSVTPSIAERNRAAAGLNLAVRHLAERQEKHIHAKQVDGKVLWLVESQSTPGKYYHVLRAADGWQYDSCDCQDATHRATQGGCKHRRSVDLIASVVTPRPAAEFAPAGGWLRDNVKRQRHQVQEEV